MDFLEGKYFSLKNKKKVICFIGIAIAPLLVQFAGGYWMQILMMTFLFSILAVSLNLILGYAGQVNLAHGVLFGAGAYASGLLVMRLGVNFWLTIPIAALTATAIAFVVGYITLRLRGTYFSLATFGFVVMMLAVYSNLSGLTGGQIGLMPIPPASIGGLVLGPNQRLVRTYIVLAFLLLTMFIIDRIVHSRVGRAFIVIRENEDLAKSSGVNTFWYKMLAFGISSFFAGMTGAIYATYQGMISPADISLVVFFQILAACVVGGLGTLIGPVIGTAFVQFLPEILKGFSEAYYYLVFGILLIIIVIWAPKGIMGGVEALRKRFASTRTAKKET